MSNAPDWHAVVHAGNCAFGAGTRNTYNTYVGSEDMGGLIRDSINQLSVCLFACLYSWFFFFFSALAASFGTYTWFSLMASHNHS